MVQDIRLRQFSVRVKQVAFRTMERSRLVGLPKPFSKHPDTPRTKMRQFLCYTVRCDEQVAHYRPVVFHGEKRPALRCVNLFVSFVFKPFRDISDKIQSEMNAPFLLLPNSFAIIDTLCALLRRFVCPTVSLFQLFRRLLLLIKIYSYV